MKKNICLFTVLFFIAIGLHAQSDMKAKAVLDKASAKLKKTALKISFTLEIEDTKTEKKETIKGEAYINKDKFKIVTPKVQTYFDGKTQYVYVQKNNEVSITNPTREELQDVNPAYILVSYAKKSSFQFSLDNKNDLSYHIIDVFPDFRAKKSYYKTIVKINKKTLDLIAVKILSQSGVHTTFTITTIDYKQNYADAFFVYDLRANPKVIVNDLR